MPPPDATDRLAALVTESISLDTQRWSFSGPALIAVLAAVVAGTIWAVRLDGKVANLENDVTLIRSVMVQAFPAEAARAAIGGKR